jgi:hypothetical protein
MIVHFPLAVYLWGFGLLVLFVLVAALLQYFLPEAGRREYAYRLKDYLMTAPERACFNALRDAMSGEYYVFPQIHLDALLRPTMNGRDGVYAWRHINQKSVDFVLCNRELRPLLAIELDDWSHERRDRIERDRIVEALFKESALPLERLTRYDIDNVAKLRERLMSRLSSARDRQPASAFVRQSVEPTDVQG